MAQATTGLLDKLGLTNLPQEKQMSVVEKLSNLINTRVSYKFSQSLTPEERDMLSAAKETEDTKKVDEILSKHQETLEKMMEEEVTLLANELMNNNTSL